MGTMVPQMVDGLDPVKLCKPRVHFTCRSNENIVELLSLSDWYSVFPVLLFFLLLPSLWCSLESSRLTCFEISRAQILPRSTQSCTIRPDGGGQRMSLPKPNTKETALSHQRANTWAALGPAQRWCSETAPWLQGCWRRTARPANWGAPPPCEGR